jgi:hypothetical protein
VENVKFNRRVNIRFTLIMEDESQEHGDLIVPEPLLASELVGTLLQDWSVTEIAITAQNSVSEGDDSAQAD